MKTSAKYFGLVVGS